MVVFSFVMKYGFLLTFLTVIESSHALFPLLCQLFEEHWKPFIAKHLLICVASVLSTSGMTNLRVQSSPISC